MKNGVLQIPDNFKPGCLDQHLACYCCKQRGYFSHHINYGMSCPLCGQEDDYMADDDDDDDDDRLGLDFCSACGILFESGCTHASNGCTADVYNGHLIKRWKDKSTNIEYDGMPQFNDRQEYNDRWKDVQVLSMMCLNNGLHCTKGFYPKSTHPQNYRSCYIDC